jgi:peptide deformylase
MKIIKIPNKILTQKIKNISIDDIKNGLFKNLILEMKKTMIENNGVGLAANQVGEDLSIFVIDKNLAEINNIPDTFINPEIIEYSNDTSEMEEGCLSVPNYWTIVKRSKKIKIKFLDEQGNKIKLKARGFLARVLQHETDHLNGITIKDRHSQVYKL